MASVKLIVGLGNPGQAYAMTRHNVGFMVVDALTQRLDIALKQMASLEGECGKSGDVILLKPTTFMNLSGRSVQKVCHYYKVTDVLVVMDDVDTEFGKMRMREKGSAGGHNGMADIIRVLGDETPRLKIGISQPDRMDLADYVLAPFGAEERKSLPQIVERGAEICEIWLESGFERAAREAAI